MQIAHRTMDRRDREKQVRSLLELWATEFAGGDSPPNILERLDEPRSTTLGQGGPTSAAAQFSATAALVESSLLWVRSIGTDLHSVLIRMADNQSMDQIERAMGWDKHLRTRIFDQAIGAFVMAYVNGLEGRIARL